MKRHKKNIVRYLILWAILLQSDLAHAQIADTSLYLQDIKKELNAVWPKNRTINLVFHGHSVPAGFWDKHEVHTLESYPNQVLKLLKQKYPYAVINVIVTAIGGEGSVKGAARFEKDVLSHNPDVVFIDYALNDRFGDLQKTKEATESMIRMAASRNTKVILVTPSPDQRIDISDPQNPLDPFANQIVGLAESYTIGLSDPYTRFKQIVKQGKLKQVMASINHPNEEGHNIIAATIFSYF